MKSRITPRKRDRPDRGGDPLAGLVNLFDLGIVLAVAFLLAALSSLNLDDLLTGKDVTIIRGTPEGQELIVKRDEELRTITIGEDQVAGEGKRIGSVFRLSDGRTVFVEEEKP